MESTQKLLQANEKKMCIENLRYVSTIKRPHAVLSIPIFIVNDNKFTETHIDKIFYFSDFFFFEVRKNILRSLFLNCSWLMMREDKKRIYR